MYVENRPTASCALCCYNSTPSKKVSAAQIFQMYKRQQTPFYFIAALSTERLDFKLLGLAVCQVPGAISEN